MYKDRKGHISRRIKYQLYWGRFDYNGRIIGFRPVNGFQDKIKKLDWYMIFHSTKISFLPNFTNSSLSYLGIFSSSPLFFLCFTLLTFLRFLYLLLNLLLLHFFLPHRSHIYFPLWSFFSLSLSLSLSLFILVSHVMTRQKKKKKI